MYAVAFFKVVQQQTIGEVENFITCLSADNCCLQQFKIGQYLRKLCSNEKWSSFYDSLTHSLTAALDQLRVVASSTSNDPGPRSRQHQQIGQRLLPLAAANFSQPIFMTHSVYTYFPLREFGYQLFSSNRFTVMMDKT